MLMKNKKIEVTQMDRENHHATIALYNEFNS